MTYEVAKTVKIGERLYSKDGLNFTVSSIKIRTDAANINKYIVFSGMSNRGFAVFYNHKQIRRKAV